MLRKCGFQKVKNGNCHKGLVLTNIFIYESMITEKARKASCKLKGFEIVGFNGAVDTA